MSIIDELTEYFKKFPGVGPRQAGRFVYYLLKQDKNFLIDLGQKIPHLKNSVRQCTKCFHFFTREIDNPVCSICRAKNRDHGQLMIIATDTDLESIEKAGSFNGTYFILGGLVPILNKNPEHWARLNELEQQISSRVKSENQEDNLEEIIIALNANPEGEYTTDLVRQTIVSVVDNLAESKKENGEIKITVLGRGLSTGTEIEYSDPDTIKNALLNRK